MKSKSRRNEDSQAASPNHFLGNATHHLEHHPGLEAAAAAAVRSFPRSPAMCSLSAVLRLCVLAPLLLLEAARGDPCVSGRYTESGECCRLCPPGEGVVAECGRDDTQCQPCREGLTSSVSEGLCLPCARCPPGVPQTSRCSASQDTQCDCGDGFYLQREGNSSEALCAACTLCKRGEGVVRPCSPLGNTLCRPCAAGTFSEESSSGRECQRCSRCQADEVEIRPCRPDSDTLCMEKDLHILSRSPELASPPPEIPRFTPQEGGNIIPVYVSILAAVVLGLLLYVAYKCWMSCKQKRALAKARSDVTTVPDGDKLHSDSGVFLDSHSLQDGHLNKGSKRDSKADGRFYLNVAPHRKEEVERLLQEGGDWSWRQLAVQLGYDQERVDVLGRGEDPVRTLLTDWAARDGSTLSALCSALTRIDRPDVASALCCPAQGSSVV
ncbi:tumor necrosis factor receptor superfamily member 16-like isoform X2 [Arapaima gigas]